MAKKVLKRNNAKHKEKAGDKTAAIPKQKRKEKKKAARRDLDYSTIRLKTQQNEDKRLISFYVHDRLSQTDVEFCEHRDYLSSEVRNALKEAGIAA